MLVVSGALLVLVSWLVFVGVVQCLGATPSLLLASDRPRSMKLRHSMWIGTSLLLLSAMIVNFFVPLGSVTAIILVGVASLVSVALTVIVGKPRSALNAWIQASVPLLGLFACLALVVTQLYLAFAALGPITNYDSGLYHLGAVEYGREYPAIPGLASVYGPLGYSTGEFPMAALFGAGPWGSNGVRLVNGFLMGILALDLSLRILRRRWSPGTYVLAVGLVTAWVPLVALADYWVTSPSQDTSAWILCLAAVAYLTDAVGRKKFWVDDMVVAIVVSIAVVLIRPTLGAFAVGIVGVGLFLAIKRQWRGRAVILVGFFGFLAAATVIIRDVILSGWILYPMSSFPVPVEWRSPDPSYLRIATLGYHRDAENLWASVEGWDWIAAWTRRLPSSWEFFELLSIGVAAVLVAFLVRGRTKMLMRPLLLAMAPSGIAVLVWFLFAPPSFRFAWGAIFTLAVTPLGWFLWRLSNVDASRILASNVTRWGIIASLVSVVTFTSIVRFDHEALTGRQEWRLGVSIPYAVAPISKAPTTTVLTLGGVELLVPIENEQCWGTFPLCTPDATRGLSPRGPSMADGFIVY